MRTEQTEAFDTAADLLADTEAWMAPLTRVLALEAAARCLQEAGMPAYCFAALVENRWPCFSGVDMDGRPWPPTVQVMDEIHSQVYGESPHPY